MIVPHNKTLTKIFKQQGRRERATAWSLAPRSALFLSMNPLKQIRQHWFAVSSSFAPYVGYGFATDVHIDPVMHPQPDFPDGSNAYKTFSWQLHPCKVATCLHLFMRPDIRERWEIFSGLRPQGHDSLTGQRWYELIFKPLGLIGGRNNPSSLRLKKFRTKMSLTKSAKNLIGRLLPFQKKSKHFLWYGLIKKL
jgi:hypothetical protein